MIPDELAPYHESLDQMRSEYDALAIGLDALRIVAARLAYAAAKAAKALPFDADCPHSAAGLTQISGGMSDLAHEFAGIHDVIAAQAADFAGQVMAFELALNNGKLN